MGSEDFTWALPNRWFSMLPGDEPSPLRAQCPAAPRIVCLASLAAAALISCVGRIGDAPGGTPTPMLPDDGGGVVAMPGWRLLRRLTNAEYDRTIRDLLGVDTHPSRDFPADPSAFGFDNDATSLTISPLHAERYRDAAEAIAVSVLDSQAKREALVGCDPTVTENRVACLRSFITRFGLRAYRRPLSEAEITGLLSVASVADEDEDRYVGSALIIEAILQSSSFLFRSEFGAEDVNGEGAHHLTGYEIATRLSYMLWSTTPDDALLARAAAGQLDTVEGVEEAARFMLADARAHEAMTRFYQQWLRMDTLIGVRRDPLLFPGWNGELRSAMSEETSRVLDDLIWRDGADFFDLFTGRYSFVNAPLAALYGVTPPSAGQDWARVDFADTPERGGFFTHASYLTLTAHTESSKIIHRGKFVREVMLCQPLPPPPANVPAIPPAIVDETDIERLERHRHDPSCSGCHQLMDPIGTGLRQYDSIGAYVPLDSHGEPVIATGSIVGVESPDFDGPLDLGRHLRAMPAVSQCVVRQVYRYTFGRPEDMRVEGDLGTIQGLDANFRDSQYDFRGLLLALVRSSAFRETRPGTAGGN